MFRNILIRKQLWILGRRVRWGGFRAIIALVILLAIIASIYSLIDDKILPPIKTASCLKAVSIATRIINETVFNEFSRLGEENSLIIMDKDIDGNISMIRSDIPQMNIINSRIAAAIIEKIDSINREKINVPIGTLIGSKSFAGFGPDINIQIAPMGSIRTDFKSELSEAGINQTRYRLSLNVQCRIRVIAPLFEETEDVTTNVPLMDTIIVGKVPNTYVGVN